MIAYGWLERVWYGSAHGGWLLLPLSWLFALFAALRRTLYRSGLLSTSRPAVPVVVIGNITVGGTGKTPLVLWLADQMRQRGFRVGIASRGYGRAAGRRARIVRTDDAPSFVGDEPLLMARRGVGPVAVCGRRAKAVRRLMEEQVNLVLCDDGLQHYALARDLEIAVIDGQRRFGNGRLLPAGPLREPISRLRSVNWRICHDGTPAAGEISMWLEGSILRRVARNGTMHISEFRGQRCHAVAAIGNPYRFFKMLKDVGIDVIPHQLPDHAIPRLTVLGISEAEPVIMTEKDAVKCPDGDRFDAWYLPVEARVDPAGGEIVDEIEALCAKDVRLRG